MGKRPSHVQRPKTIAAEPCSRRDSCGRCMLSGCGSWTTGDRRPAPPTPAWGQKRTSNRPQMNRSSPITPQASRDQACGGGGTAEGQWPQGTPPCTRHSARLRTLQSNPGRLGLGRGHGRAEGPAVRGHGQAGAGGAGGRGDCPGGGQGGTRPGQA